MFTIKLHIGIIKNLFHRNLHLRIWIFKALKLFMIMKTFGAMLFEMHSWWNDVIGENCGIELFKVMLCNDELKRNYVMMVI